MEVTLLTNGPGELWGWARPVIAELRKRGHRVSLWLLPCQYASGHEREAASGLGADKLEGPYAALRTWRLLGGEKTDRVIQLGGDLFFGRRLAEWAGAPLLCYAYGYKKGMERARVFTAYASMAESIGAKLKAPVNVIGDLVKDSLLLEGNKGTRAPVSGPPHVLLFPGSRPAIRKLALGWFGSVTEHLAALVPGVRFSTLFSPFTPESEFHVWESAGLNPIKSDAASAMSDADYAITQPGTNTLEIMHCGLPALVTAPSSFLNAAPVSGLAGAVCGIPLLGPALKKWKLRRVLERYDGFLSLPNRIAGRMIMDEAMGDISPRDVAELTAAALMDKKKLSRVRGELLELSGGNSGAASRLCDSAEIS